MAASLFSKGSRKSGASCSSNEIAAANYGSQHYYPQSIPWVQRLGSLSSVTTDGEDCSPIKHMENIVKVRNILMQVNDPLESMLTVDYLQKLGIDYHFTEEIEAMLASLYKSLCPDDSEPVVHDLFEVTLSFRLLRQAGHPISSDVLTRFTNEEGIFESILRTDVQGLVSLYEASYLNTGEYLLDKANEFSIKCLTSYVENSEPEAAKLVTHALKNPHHMTISRYNVRHYLDHHQTKYRINGTLEELARLDFNLIQSEHQKEFRMILSWWKSTDLAEELQFARKQPLKWYLWAVTVLHDPKFSKCRIELTKIIAFVYIIDDIYDIYGSLDELILFTAAISKWDLSCVETLPLYMQSCYKALYNTTNEIAQNIYEEHGWNPIDSLRKSWSRLCNAFLVESRWLRSEQVPTADEYLGNAVITSGVHTVFMHIFFLLGEGITKENIDFLESNPPLLSCPATILRLWDDLGSAKDENQEGFDGSYVDYYMKENPQCHIHDARDRIKQLIDISWKNLNKECFSRGHFSPNLVISCQNSARMVEVMYRYDDNQKLPIFEDYVNALLFKSM